MFLSVSACIHIVYGCGMKFSSLDAAHSKHAVFRRGPLHMLTTRDGNNRVLPLALAVCETESTDTYHWFAEQCYQSGLGRYLKDSIVYTDRMKGIAAFYARFEGVYEAHCFKHIVENCRKHIRGSGRTFQSKTAWALRDANTREQYLEQLAILRAQSPQAGHYFDSTMVHEQVFQYAMNENKVATHGFKTNQIAECLNGVFVPARHHTPYRLFDSALEWIGGQFAERHADMVKHISARQHILTPYAMNNWKIQVWAQP